MSSNSHSSDASAEWASSALATWRSSLNGLDFPQIVAHCLGVPPDAVTLIYGDTGAIRAYLDALPGD